MLHRGRPVRRHYPEADVRRVHLLIAAITFTLLAALAATGRAESKHVFGIHFWGRGANVDVMSHETGWIVEANLGRDSPNLFGRIDPGAGESFTLIQRLDWDWSFSDDNGDGIWGTVPISAAQQDTFANQCGNFANSIKKWCRHYVIGNEMELHDGVTVGVYVSAFQKVRNAIKAVQPDARVIVGHFVSEGNVRACLQALGRDGYDGITDHTGSSVPHSKLDMLDDPTLHAGLAARPDVGVYITEFGWVRDTNPNAMTVIRNFYQNLGFSNANRDRQVFCACWFVYPQGIGWNNFALELATIDNPAFQAATALHTSFNSYADNPVIMSDMIAEVPDAGSSINVSWTTNVPARRQLWWVTAGQLEGQSKFLIDSLQTSHAFSITAIQPSTVYEVMPISTANDHGDAGGRRFRVKTGPWPSTVTQTGAGRVLVEWDTDWTADTRVDFGPTASLGQTLAFANLVTHHAIEVTGLDPGTLYYRIRSKEPNPDGGDALAMISPVRTFFVGFQIPGDCDGDDDVDLEDFGCFQVCYTGPGIPQPAEPCQFARLDEDEDVDISDFGVFQACLSGANIPADPDCVD